MTTEYTCYDKITYCKTIMDNLIKGLEEFAFSGEDIMKICEGKTKILRYPELYKYKDINSMFKPYNTVVLLYETEPGYGHWVCMIKHKNNTVEFYDPYGLAVDLQLNWIKEPFKTKNKSSYPILSKMLLESPYKIVYNSAQLQKYNNDTATCGRHVAFRIVMKHLELNKYIKLLTSSLKNTPDEIVTYLTAYQK